MLFIHRVLSVGATLVNADAEGPNYSFTASSEPRLLAMINNVAAWHSSPSQASTELIHVHFLSSFRANSSSPIHSHWHFFHATANT